MALVTWLHHDGRDYVGGEQLIQPFLLQVFQLRQLDTLLNAYNFITVPEVFLETSHPFECLYPA